MLPSAHAAISKRPTTSSTTRMCICACNDADVSASDALGQEWGVSGLSQGGCITKAAYTRRIIPAHLVLRDASMGTWRNASSSMQHFCGRSSSSAPHTDVRVLQKEGHMIAHKIQQAH